MQHTLLSISCSYYITNIAVYAIIIICYYREEEKPIKCAKCGELTHYEKVKKLSIHATPS